MPIAMGLKPIAIGRKNLSHAAKYTCDVTNDSNLRENNSKASALLD